MRPAPLWPLMLALAGVLAVLAFGPPPCGAFAAGLPPGWLNRLLVAGTVLWLTTLARNTLHVRR